MIKIYKLIYNNEIVYVGKTKKKYLCSRKAEGYKYNEKLHKIIKECRIELIEETDDVSRERYWIDKLRSEGHALLNKISGVTGLDRETYRKEHYQKNKEKNREYKKEYLGKYYQKNKEDINRKRKEKRKKIKINNE